MFKILGIFRSAMYAAAAAVMPGVRSVVRCYAKVTSRTVSTSCSPAPCQSTTTRTITLCLRRRNWKSFAKEPSSGLAKILAFQTAMVSYWQLIRNRYTILSRKSQNKVCSGLIYFQNCFFYITCCTSKQLAYNHNVNKRPFINYVTFFQHFLPPPSLPVTKCHSKLPSPHNFVTPLQPPSLRRSLVS